MIPLGLFLFRSRCWSEYDGFSRYFYEHIPFVLEPLWVGWCGIFAPWVCFGRRIREVVNCLRKSFEKECIITGECKHFFPTIDPKFSEHGFGAETRNSLEAFEEVGESGVRGGHGFLDYSI